MNILLVDDDAMDRALVKRALKDTADVSELYEVSSVEEGLSVLGDKHFDVILLDYRMPKVDGIEMVIELRSRPHLGETAIVMISSSDDESLAISCLQVGAQDFITKSEITPSKLRRSFVQARKRFELEKRLYDSFCQVKELAEKDSLTGLSNRYHFEEALKSSIFNNQRLQHTIALLLLDLDHFKKVNDNYGHEVGDKLLKKVAERINVCLRGNELCGRLGGDEFAILITGLRFSGDASLIAQRILKSFEEPIVVDDLHIQCSVSIGIALHPNNAHTAETLTKYADIAMYRAKNRGRNQLCYFEDVMQKQFSREYQIEIELKKAVKNNEFTLVYQPVISVNSRKIIGVEALIRWPNNSNNSTPDEFIPIAEQSNTINHIGEWVLNTAIEQLSLWQSNFDVPMTMAINLSAVQLGDNQLLPKIKTLFKQFKIKPENITFELTETALLTQDADITERISLLEALGCKLALDDFGTGFSSLSHLLNYPISIVKLDRSLLPTKPTEKRHLAIVKGISVMANTIGLHIVAEGVETEFQCQLCDQLNVDEIQGYYFSKPISAEEIEQQWLK